jgi:hypothetical protein
MGLDMFDVYAPSMDIARLAAQETAGRVNRFAMLLIGGFTVHASVEHASFKDSPVYGLPSTDLPLVKVTPEHVREALADIERQTCALIRDLGLTATDPSHFGN